MLVALIYHFCLDLIPVAAADFFFLSALFSGDRFVALIDALSNRCFHILSLVLLCWCLCLVVLSTWCTGSGRSLALLLQVLLFVVVAAWC